MSDATFADGAEAPLRLRAFEVADLDVISAVVQDAVFPSSEMNWQRPQRRFAILLNRFRWEDVDNAKTCGRPVERVQSVLAIEDVVGVKSSGVTRGDADTVLSVLKVEFVPGDDGTGAIELTLAGDGAIRVEVEALEVTLGDVTRPYVAPSGSTPSHPE